MPGRPRFRITSALSLPACRNSRAYFLPSNTLDAGPSLSNDAQPTTKVAWAHITEAILAKPERNIPSQQRDPLDARDSPGMPRAVRPHGHGTRAGAGADHHGSGTVRLSRRLAALRQLREHGHDQQRERADRLPHRRAPALERRERQHHAESPA